MITKDTYLSRTYNSWQGENIVAQLALFQPPSLSHNYSPRLHHADSQAQLDTTNRLLCKENMACRRLEAVKPHLSEDEEGL